MRIENINILFQIKLLRFNPKESSLDTLLIISLQEELLWDIL